MRTDRALRPAEVAEILNVSTRTVQRLCERKKLIGFPVGRALRIMESSLAKYIREESERYKVFDVAVTGRFRRKAQGGITP